MANGKRIDYEVLENLGTISTSRTGWTREVNIIAWNGNAPKVDIRSWDPEHERMDRGSATYTEREAKELMKILNDRFGGRE